MIVCLEGIDAAGKATQAARLAARLKADVLSFPDYETPSGRLIGDHLQRRWHCRHNDGMQELDAMVFQSLMLTNRMEAAPQIQYALTEGDSLVLDRYWPSGFAYGSADGLDADWLLSIHAYLPQAHMYILLDVDPSESTERRPERADRYEMQPGLMEEVASNYLQLWAAMHGKHPSEWRVVDGNGSVDQVTNNLWDQICGGAE